jgi:hypothetical protein
MSELPSSLPAPAALPDPFSISPLTDRSPSRELGAPVELVPWFDDPTIARWGTLSRGPVHDRGGLAAAGSRRCRPASA